MSRPVEDRPPTAIPTERDLIRAGVIFEEFGKDYIQNRKRFALIVVVRKDSEIPEFMQRYFGGTVYTHGASQRRWQITDVRMHDFIEKIHPYLYEHGRGVVEDVLVTDAHFRRMEARLLNQQSHVLSETGIPLPGVREAVGESAATPIPPDSVNLVLEPPGSEEAAGDIATLREWLASPDTASPIICKALDEVSRWRDLLQTSLAGIAAVRVDGEHLIVERL